jgi:hypothetical protein
VDLLHIDQRTTEEHTTNSQNVITVNSEKVMRCGSFISTGSEEIQRPANTFKNDIQYPLITTSMLANYSHVELKSSVNIIPVKSRCTIPLIPFSLSDLRL